MVCGRCAGNPQRTCCASCAIRRICTTCAFACASWAPRTRRMRARSKTAARSRTAKASIRRCRSSGRTKHFSSSRRATCHLERSRGQPRSPRLRRFAIAEVAAVPRQTRDDGVARRAGGARKSRAAFRPDPRRTAPDSRLRSHHSTTRPPARRTSDSIAGRFVSASIANAMRVLTGLISESSTKPTNQPREPDSIGVWYSIAFRGCSASTSHHSPSLPTCASDLRESPTSGSSTS